MQRLYLLCTLFSFVFIACAEEKIFQGRYGRAVDQKEVFLQEPTSKVDILWIVDNSLSMEDEQEKLANGFLPFFKQLIEAKVDYHIGVITTDLLEKGILRKYTGAKVIGCDSCTFLTTEVPCKSLQSNNGDDCPAKEVFSNLIRVGTLGGSLEEGFASALLALSGNSLNKDFLRKDASLFLIFVSDEDEGLKEAGESIEYYQRFFSSLKGKGNENLVKASAITGWPLRSDAIPIHNLFPLLDEAKNSKNRSKELNDALDILKNREPCLKVHKNANDSVSETGTRYINLAYLLNGVFSNLCKNDYSADLEKLGASACSLKKRFKLILAEKIESGPDGVLFSEDDLLLDCNDDGKLDSPICVFAQGLDANVMSPVDFDPIFGWTFDEKGSAILFGRNFFPKPGTEIMVHYKLYRPVGP